MTTKLNMKLKPTALGVQPGTTEAELEWQGAYHHTCRRSVFEDRHIVITPFDGGYDSTAGVVICIEGTPLRGCMIVQFSGATVVSMHVVDQHMTRRIRQPRAVRPGEKRIIGRLWRCTLALLAERKLVTNPSQALDEEGDILT